MNPWQGVASFRHMLPSVFVTLGVNLFLTQAHDITSCKHPCQGVRTTRELAFDYASVRNTQAQIQGLIGTELAPCLTASGSLYVRISFFGQPFIRPTIGKKHCFWCLLFHLGVHYSFVTVNALLALNPSSA